MITIEEMQVVGAFVMLLFGIFVIASPNRNLISLKTQNQIINKSRWLLASGLTLFSVQFMLQRLMGFRSIGVSQSVAINLIFFVPAFVLVNLSVLNLLTFGKLKPWHTRLGVGVVGLVYALLAAGAVIGEGGLMGGSTAVRVAEIASSTSEGFIILFYSIEAWKLYRNIGSRLDDYYDTPQQSLIRWFAVSAVLFAILAILTPITTFTTRSFVLQFHGFLAFSAIAFLVMSFLRYSNENSMMLLMPVEPEPQEIIAEENKEVATTDAPDDINEKVGLWLEGEHYLRAGITAAEIACELDATRDELKQYIQSQGFQRMGSWLAYHRVEYAKKLLLEHDKYNHDTIAEMCGFSSRVYFQKCFKDVMGVPPMMWQQSNRES